MAKPPGFRPDSYPHLTNGGEKQDERPQAAFAKRASLSRSFASQEAHHGSGPDSHPGVRPPSRRYPLSCWQASDQNVGPRPPASAAQSPHEPGALALPAPTHAPATSARPAATASNAPGDHAGREPRTDGLPGWERLGPASAHS